MSDAPKKLVVDLSTGAQQYIDLTPEEIEQREVDAQHAAIEKSEQDAALQSKSEARLRAHAKLLALGLSAEEIAELG